MQLKEQETMLANLDRVMRQLRRRPQGRAHGGRGTYRILRHLAESPGLSTRQLAERMDIRPASLNERLGSLESEGLIRRQRDPRDQRVHVLELEPAGARRLEEAKVQRQAMEEAIDTILTAAEIRQLARLADKLAQGLERLGPVRDGAADHKPGPGDGE